MSAARFHIHSIRSSMKESYWVHAFLDSRNLLIAALFAAVFCLCISYPGNLYSDSYGRIDFTKALMAGPTETLNSWNTVTPCYFLYLAYVLTGNIASYTFAQAFFFFYTGLLLIRKTTGTCRTLVYCLYLLNPIFFCVSIYHETGIGVLIGLTGIFLLMNIDPKELGPFDKGICYFFIMLSSFVAFGFRANTFTVLPALLLILFFFNSSAMGHKILCTAFLFGGLFLTILIPKLLNIDTMSSVSLSFLWEMGENIGSMPDEKQEQYKQYLDDLFGEGATEKLAAWSRCEGILGLEDKTSDEYRDYLIFTFGSSAAERLLQGKTQKWPLRQTASFQWEVEEFSQTSISQVGLGKIFAKYLALYIREPAASLWTKARFISYTLGISPQLKLLEWNYDRWERGKEFGMSDSQRRHQFIKAYRFVVNKSFFPLRPWLILLIALACTGLKLKLQKQRIQDSLECQLILISVFYYGAFLINNQTMEFRYFYPAFYLLTLTILSSLASLTKYSSAFTSAIARRFRP